MLVWFFRLRIWGLIFFFNILYVLFVVYFIPLSYQKTKKRHWKMYPYCFPTVEQVLSIGCKGIFRDSVGKLSTYYLNSSFTALTSWYRRWIQNQEREKIITSCMCFEGIKWDWESSQAWGSWHSHTVGESNSSTGNIMHKGPEAGISLG